MAGHVVAPQQSQAAGLNTAAAEQVPGLLSPFHDPVPLCTAGEEDTFEYTEEEQEEGPEQLAVLEADEEVMGGSAWSPLFSSSNEHVKNQVGVGAA